MDKNISIRFAGKGGQGIIFSGVVLARAFSLHESGKGGDYHAYQTQSYGPEARGGASKCDVKISTDENSYPFVEIPDHLIVMSQEAMDRYIISTKKNTVLYIDKGQINAETEMETYHIPATEKAEEMGAKIVANVIMLGAFVEISKIISKAAIHEAIHDISPRGTKELNRKAFRVGNILGRHVLLEKDTDDLARTEGISSA